jgi:phosphopantothenoylcysteine decarboxylase/phosphopantothenate--cysteine ligase
LRDLGANVSFVTGPATVPRPNGVKIIEVQTAAQMHTAVRDALPADAAVFAAAVADWHVLNATDAKIKKSADGALPILSFAENPDILATVSQLSTGRPPLVVGFAAETSDVVDNAKGKLVRKGCDWIVANDVSPETGIMGGTENKIHLVTANGVEDWPRLTKVETARRLAVRIADTLAPKIAR